MKLILNNKIQSLVLSQIAAGRVFIYTLLYGLIFWGCEERVAIPKPHAYPRVIYPEKQYKPFAEGYCPLTFEQATYSTIEQDTLFFGEKPKSDCWFNLQVKSLNATIHCTYSTIENRKELDELVQDAFTLVQKHNVKASFIEEIPVHRTAGKVHGMVFKIEGAAASPYQFYMTDSTKNFLRGALYINTESRPDSLAPVIDFMKLDVNKLIETLKWRG